jgi:pyruvate-formate lyase-activating enzyme
MADPRDGEHVATHRHRHRIPVRASLPPLTEYARLRIGSEERTAGYAEASRGCRHRCRHCPVPTVYDGRYRIVAPEVVVADVASQVAAGARHITFGDPDFWNGPAHAMRVIETIHDEHPEVTFDVTIKVEHLLRHRELLGRLADAGVVFVVSAFEHTDDEVLRLLDKGHTRADMAEAARLVRDADMGLRPTWLPFTPWTTPTHLADIVRFIDEQGLWAETDPIQLTIRLLLPDGSLLTGHEAMAPYLSGADDGALGAAWAHPDPAMDRLAAEVAALAGGGGCDRDRLVAIVDAIGRVTGEPMPTVPDVSTGIGLTESWFCCAEPSADQLATLRS